MLMFVAIAPILLYGQSFYTTEQWQEKLERDELRQLREKEASILCRQAKRSAEKVGALVQATMDSIAVLERVKNEAIAKIEYDFALKINPLKSKIELQTRQKPIVPRIVIENATCD